MVNRLESLRIGGSSAKTHRSKGAKRKYLTMKQPKKKIQKQTQTKRKGDGDKNTRKVENIALPRNPRYKAQTTLASMQ